MQILEIADMNRARTEVDRLILQLQADPIAAPLIARCGRPAVEYRGDGKTYLVPKLIIPCPDRAAVHQLKRLDWDWYYIPFFDNTWGICFETPTGFSQYHYPTDPRIETLAAILSAYLPEAVAADVEIDNGQCWDGEVWITLCCSTLVSLNELFRHWDALNRFAVALVPDLMRFSLFLTDDVLPGNSCILLDWYLNQGRWEPFKQEQFTDRFALALLYEAGFEWLSDWNAYRGLQASLRGDTLQLAGDNDAVDACLALIEPLRALIAQLRSIPQIARVKRLAVTHTRPLIAGRESR